MSGILRPAMFCQLRRRIEQSEWSSPMTRGLSPSAATMNWSHPPARAYSLKAEVNAYHNSKSAEAPYDLNPDLWAAPFASYLTGVVFAKDDCGTSYGPVAGQCWHSRYGGVAITRRHVLYCGHAYPHAQGTWINGNTTNTPPTRLRFLTTDGYPVDRIQLHQKTWYGTAYRGQDLCVGVMDEDLPESIHVLRVVPVGMHTAALDRLYVSQEWHPAAEGEHASYGIHTMMPDPQNAHADPDAVIPGWGYPLQHRMLVWRFSGYGRMRVPNYGTQGGFRHAVWGGDSGTPGMVLLGGELVLRSIVSGGGLFSKASEYPNIWPGEKIDSHEYVNRMIDKADDNAIALGRMTERTNYRVTAAPLPEGFLK